MSFKLICFDMDGVIFKDTNFWIEVHRVFGTIVRGQQLTDKYLYTDYNTLVKEVVTKLWKNKPADKYVKLVNSLEYNPGIKELFKHLKQKDYITAIISSGSIDLARRAQKDFGIDHLFANELIIRDNRVTGEFVWPLAAGQHKKAEILLSLCKDLNISPKEAIYIGDNESDIEAFQNAGLSIAFNSQSNELKIVATHIIDSNNLKDLIKFLP